MEMIKPMPPAAKNIHLNNMKYNLQNSYPKHMDSNKYSLIFFEFGELVDF